MERRIVDVDGEYVLGPGGAAPEGVSLVPVPDIVAETFLRRWVRDEPQRTELRSLAAELLPGSDLSCISDDDLVARIAIQIGSGTHLVLYRIEAMQSRSETVTLGGAADAQESEPADAPVSDEPQIHPCDFEKVVIKCKHMPDPAEKAGKRTMTAATFWREGGVDRTDLPPPPSGSNRAYTKVIEVVASDVERGADDITIQLQGGPGYTCSRNHPKVTIVDSQQQRQVFEGQTSVTFKAVCRALPPPPETRESPIALMLYYFFPQQGMNMYRVDVESCGVLRDGSYGFGRTQQQIRVYPKDTYKLALEIPALKKKSFERSRQTLNDGTVIDSRESTRSSLSESETTSHEESTSSSKLTVSDSYEYRTRGGGLKETTESTLDANNHLETGTSLKKVHPIDNPAREAAASFSFTRNGSDIKGASTIGQFINALVNIENQIASVMNFIKEFQPQVGWKFVFEMELFKGELSYEWGYKEWEDHTVYPWWKFEIGMTLFALSLELSFGAQLKVAGVGITAVIFGKTSVDAKVSASKEASPDDPAPWELAVSSEPTGELGIRAALGDGWVKAEGKLTCGFPFEAKCECSTREPFHIDWKLEFTGVKANVVGSVKFIGSIQRSWTVVEERKNWKTGRFPGGDPEQKPLRGQHGIVAH